MKPDAIDKAYKKYHKELQLYALSLCRNEVMANDLVSETFYKALITSNIPEVSFKYWLFKVLKNHYIDVKRKNSNLKTIDYYEETVKEQSEREPSCQQSIKERNKRLYAHLMTLEPELYRECLYLFYYSGMSIKAISRTVNISEANTKTILHRARKKLGRQLKEDSYEF